MYVAANVLERIHCVNMYVAVNVLERIYYVNMYVAANVFGKELPAASLQKRQNARFDWRTDQVPCYSSSTVSGIQAPDHADNKQ
jgi:hypothetical protein